MKYKKSKRRFPDSAEHPEADCSQQHSPDTAREYISPWNHSPSLRHLQPCRMPHAIRSNNQLQVLVKASCPRKISLKILCGMYGTHQISRRIHSRNQMKSDTSARILMYSFRIQPRVSATFIRQCVENNLNDARDPHGRPLEPPHRQ